jgi:hypothetical protein
MRAHPEVSSFRPPIPKRLDEHFGYDDISPIRSKSVAAPTPMRARGTAWQYAPERHWGNEGLGGNRSIRATYSHPSRPRRPNQLLPFPGETPSSILTRLHAQCRLLANRGQSRGNWSLCVQAGPRGRLIGLSRTPRSRVSSRPEQRVAAYGDCLTTPALRVSHIH